MNNVICLPQLDGSRQATDARLGAWLHEQDLDPIEDAAYAIGSHVAEAMTSARAVGAPAEECRDENCMRASDVEYLLDELGRAMKALSDLKAATAEAQVQRIGGAA